MIIKEENLCSVVNRNKLHKGQKVFLSNSLTDLIVTVQNFTQPERLDEFTKTIDVILPYRYEKCFISGDDYYQYAYIPNMRLMTIGEANTKFEKTGWQIQRIGSKSFISIKYIENTFYKFTTQRGRTHIKTLKELNKDFTFSDGTPFKVLEARK